MSFPRAKLKRFNEIPEVTPSPAEYNVDLKQKAKLAFIPQSERFIEPKSPPMSETGSTQSTPIFRTPTVIKKKKFLSSASKLKKFLTSNDKELLNEKTVECNNKDVFINELTEQLEELKDRIYKLNAEIEEFQWEKENFIEGTKQIQQLHQIEIEELKRSHDDELTELKGIIEKTKEDLEILMKEKVELMESVEKHEVLTETYQEDIGIKDKMIEDTEVLLKEVMDEKKMLEEKYEVEIEKMKGKHKEEIENIEFEMLKCVHEIQNRLDEEKLKNESKMKELQKHFDTEIFNLNKIFNEEKEKINKENILRIKQLEENMSEMTVLSDIQAKEKLNELENYWKNKTEQQKIESSEILKECQAISEYNIIQSEIEKNDYKLKLEKEIKKYKELEKKYDNIYFNYKQLQNSYSNVQNKLYRLIKEVKESEIIKNNFDKLLNEKQTYEATILRSQQTIDVLKYRLTESDQDVEQLKKEINENERKLLEFEDKLNVLNEELEEERLKNNELMIENETSLKIAKESVEKFEELSRKVDVFKEEIEDNKRNDKVTLEKLNLEKKELLNFIEKQQIINQESQNLIDEAYVEIEQLTLTNSDCNDEIEILNQKNTILQTDFDDLLKQKEHWLIEKKELDFKIDILKNELEHFTKQEEKNKKIEELTKLYEEYKQKSLDQENELKKLLNKCNNLEKLNKVHLKTIDEQNALIAPFKEQLEDYELEMNNLQNAKNHMENEAKDLGLKYAQILGHQNHKQKIKYMINLKNKNEELLKANLDLEAKLKTMEKKNEKIRKENMELKKITRKQTIFEDKENVSSPNRSFKCESPGPLRELN